ncbi:unnamed protein product [Acanthosepion pharaonis]|uniref:Uncharacterized protein n=1 Tax=Acanthosepion pharaonis TaxID=158019 RepID=A0A812C7I7_ACAPH|nr:unnamed protein product [Sepia pharaonis]
MPTENPRVIKRPQWPRTGLISFTSVASSFSISIFISLSLSLCFSLSLAASYSCRPHGISFHSPPLPDLSSSSSFFFLPKCVCTVFCISYVARFIREIASFFTGNSYSLSFSSSSSPPLSLSLSLSLILTLFLSLTYFRYLTLFLTRSISYCLSILLSLTLSPLPSLSYSLFLSSYYVPYPLPLFHFLTNPSLTISLLLSLSLF